MSNVTIKICGVQTVEEARLLTTIGVDFIGLNFVPSSVRCLQLDEAVEIMAVIKNSISQSVALFKDQPMQLAKDYIRQLRIDYVQLNGDEPLAYAQAMPVPVMRAIAVDPGQSAADLLNIITNYPVKYIILDRQIQGQGDIINLDLVHKIIAEQPTRIFLAGGLSPDNLASVLLKLKPFGIDIAGGIRTDGRLDMTKVAECLSILRQA